MKKKNSIAIIPARKNSLRIKNKNIKNFFKYPIIYFSIKAALKSNCFDEIYVSTDSKKIAELAQSFGAKVPFVRSKKLSGDKVSTKSVMQDAIKRIIEIKKFDYVCCIYPASPFIKAKNLKKAFKIVKKKRGIVLPICAYSANIQRSFKINKKGNLSYNENSLNKRTQDLLERYYDSGQFYFGRSEDFFKKKLIDNSTTPIFLDKFETIDINDLSDWRFAEKLFKLLKN